MILKDVLFLLPWMFLAGILALWLHRKKLQNDFAPAPDSFFMVWADLTLILGMGMLAMSLPAVPPQVLIILICWTFIWFFVSGFVMFCLPLRWAAFPASYVFGALLCFFCLPPAIRYFDKVDFHPAISVCAVTVIWMAIAALTVSHKKNAPRLLTSTRLKLGPRQN